MLVHDIFGVLVPQATLGALVLCLVISAIGFFRLVYFISIGYGFSIAALGVASVAIGFTTASPIAWIQALLLTLYGLRLGLYLVLREMNAAYRSALSEDDRFPKGSFGLKLVIWISVSLLYVCQYMPAIARFVADARGVADPLPALSIAGLVIIALGLAIEAISDAQKSAAKRANPKRFCDVGLYRLSRYPNYFGEILVWTGNLIAGASILRGSLAWILAAAGYVCIVLVMIGSARRLELGQSQRYGADPEYQDYTRTVPILVPLLPVFSLKDAKIYLG